MLTIEYMKSTLTISGSEWVKVSSLLLVALPTGLLLVTASTGSLAALAGALDSRVTSLWGPRSVLTLTGE